MVHLRHRGASLGNADELKAKAAECLALAAGTSDARVASGYRMLALAFERLAAWDRQWTEAEGRLDGLARAASCGDGDGGAGTEG